MTPPFWERAAHSFFHLFSFLCLFVVLIVSPFWFREREMALIASVPGHFFPFPFYYSMRHLDANLNVCLNN